jgi:hypothetical protein
MDDGIEKLTDVANEAVVAYLLCSKPMVLATVSLISGTDVLLVQFLPESHVSPSHLAFWSSILLSASDSQEFGRSFSSPQPFFLSSICFLRWVGMRTRKRIPHDIQPQLGRGCYFLCFRHALLFSISGLSICKSDFWNFS